MKRALTIWIDDDATLVYYQAAFVCRKGDNEKAVTLQNASVPEDKDAMYIPWTVKENTPIKFFKEAEG